MMHTSIIETTTGPDPARVLAKAVLNAAHFLDINHSELAEILGVSAASVSRITSGNRSIPLEATEGQLAILFLRLFRSLDSLMGGDEHKSRAWLHAHNRHLNGTPVDLLGNVEGLVGVVHYLDAMRGRI